MTKFIRALATIALCASWASAGIAPTAVAEQVQYVALGDSFAAGSGAVDSPLEYINDGSNCLRSPHAYPFKVAESAGWQLSQQACQATRTTTVGPQLAALSADTDVVTITLGGNDVGVSAVLGACSTPGTTNECLGTIAAGVGVIRSRLPVALADVYAQIRTAAPNARVIAVGYPHLFTGKDCSPLTDYTRIEQRAINRATDLLNSAIAAAAGASGVEFADATRDFRKHAWCDRVPHISGPLFASTEDPVVSLGSFHPNIAGQQISYPAAVRRALNN